MASIKRPGVEVTQENVTATATISTPSLTTVIVGPCFQIVDAFDDAGAVQSEALAGTYQDGRGTIAYALPSLTTGATVDSDSIRVFRVDGAGNSTELRDSDDEETIVSGTSGVYSESGETFTDSAASFVASGVLTGDFVRVTYQGEVIDIEITGAPTATSLSIKTPIAVSTVTFATYSIVRNPPQFVYKSAAEQADVEFPLTSSPETNYLHVAIKSTAASTLVGSAGDSFKMQLKETDPDYSITYAATGTGVITATGIGTDLTSQGLAVGPLSDTSGVGSAVVFSHATAVLGATTTSGNTLEGIVDANTVVLDVHLGAAITSASQVVVGKMLADTVGDGSSTTYTQSTKALVFPSAHGIPNPPGDNTFVLLIKGSGSGTGSSGLYKVDGYSSPTEVTLDGSTNPSSDLVVGTDGKIQSFIGSDLTSVSSNGESGSLSKVYDYSASSDLVGALTANPSGKSVVFGSDAMATAAYQAVNASGVADRVITLSATLNSPAAGTSVVNGASGKQAQVVDTDPSTTFVEPSGSGVTYQIELPRTNGQSIVAIGTLASDLDSNSTFSANFDATANGSGNVTYAEATTVDFDGGVDADNILVDEDLIGSTTATHSIYVSYKALRVDVSDQASSPALTEITSTTDVTNLLGKISTDNPLALAAYFATLQSPSTTVKCLGVSATSTSEPAGTTAAYSSALTYLEGQDVYSLACLSTDPAIQALFETHVTSMSAAENKSERIAFVSQDMPSYVTATLLSSGTAGNTPSNFTSSSYSFTTDVDFSLNASLTTVLADTGSDDLILVVTARSSSSDAPTAANGVLPIKYGVKVDKSATTTQHLTDPTVLKIQSAEAAATTWDSLVDVTWSLFQMGAALTTTAQKASAVADLGAQFENKRVFLVWPDSASASVSGSATVVGGEYLAAAWAAKVGYEKPEQPFTNTKLTGFSSLSNSNTLFSRSQLDSIAGGGVWITVQDKPSSALSCRHQLSTLVDTIQNRELSITKTVDHVAKRLRAVLEPKIGSFRVTQSYLDTLGVIVEGELRNFVETNVLTSGKVNFIEVDDTDGDTVNIQVIITVPFPANYIALTLQF